MERTKILFGNDNRFDSNTLLSNSSSRKAKGNEGNPKQILDILKTNQSHINRSELINALKSSSRAEINIALSSLLSQDTQSVENVSNMSASLSSLSNTANQQNKLSNNQQSSTSSETVNNMEETVGDKLETNVYNDSNTSSGSLLEQNDTSSEENLRNKINLHTSENFDEHLSSNCVEFDDGASGRISGTRRGLCEG